MPSTPNNKTQNPRGTRPVKRKRKGTHTTSKSKPSAYTRLLQSISAANQTSLPGIDFIRAILGILCLGSFVFIIATQLIYAFKAEEIYSMVHSEVIDGSEQTAIGSYGAILGYNFFNGLLGWASFILSSLLAIAGIGLLWLPRSEFLRVVGRTIQLLAWAIWLALALAMAQHLLGKTDSVLAWGGELGNYYYRYILNHFGLLGLFITVVLGLLIILVVCSDRVLMAVNRPPKFGKPSIDKAKWWQKLWAKKQEEDEDELEDEEIEEDEEQDEEQSEEEDTLYVEEDTDEEEEIQENREQSFTTNRAEQDNQDSFTVEVAQADELVSEEELEHDSYTPGLKFKYYRKPSIESLRDYGATNVDINSEEIEERKQCILTTLANFKVQVRPKKATVGPTVTLYEVVPEQGVKVSRISSLSDDLALALKSEGIRIIAPMPGQGTVGIEVPNSKPQTVSMRSIMASQRYKDEQERMELPIGIGKTITNEPFVFDLAKMPHLLIAGATGQGKSVGLNALITSLLYSKRPEELKFVMVDPKMLEFSLYEELERHFMAKLPDSEKSIITDMSRVVPTLLSLCVEMDNRYQKLTQAKVRNIKEYNQHVLDGKLSPFDGFEFMPYIVLIVDEFADLIMTRGKEVEQPIARLAQKARAAGIHMVIATQRPSTDVITGLIKANFPARIAFKVFSMIDSRTILDSPGANQLVGRGDMLFYQGKEMIRVQCAFMDTPETEEVVRHISMQEGDSGAYELPEYIEEGETEVKDFNPRRKDALFEEAARLIVTSQVGSASILQRKMEIGFARAGRIIDQLEGAGILGPQRGSKPREILINDLDMLEDLLRRINE